MSYARWSYSAWYSFWHSSLSGDRLDDQVLALWYGTGDWSSACQDWRYDELADVDEQWLRDKYVGMTQADARHAIDIIGEFRWAVESQYKEDDPV